MNRRRLRRAWAIPALLLAVVALRAQTSVWKVTRNGNTVYLGGTCHVLRASDYPLPAEFDVAFADASTVWFETEIERLATPETQRALLAEGRLPDGKTLESVLQPATWRELQKYLAATGLPAAQLQGFKPWLLTLTLMTVEMQKLGLSLEGVDTYYHRKAVKAGKAIKPLESLEKHLAYITNLGAGHEDEMVLNMIAEASEMPAAVADILGAWKSGDAAEIDKAMLVDMREKYPAIYQELLVSRNRLWLPLIERMLQSPETELVLVGVGHLAGADGLLAALRERGCAVEQVIARK